MGRASAAPGATSMITPSRMNAVLSAMARSVFGATFPSSLTKPRSACASAADMERMARPGSSRSRSESSGTKLPSTRTMRRASTSSVLCSSARRFAAASGKQASGFASAMSARRSVYFHSSTRRLGRPSASKRRKAASRNAAISSAPGSLLFAAAKFSASADSAAVLIGRTSTFIAVSRGLVAVLHVAGGFELQRQLLAAGLHDAPLGQHVHHVGDNVIEEALVMGDHDKAARGPSQPVDPIGHDLERVDVKAGVRLVQHAELRLQNR